MVNNKKFKGCEPRYQSYFCQQSRDPLQRNQSQHREGNLISRITFQQRKLQRSERLHYPKPLDLSYKEASPRADTKIQILLLPKGSNSEIFREERLVSKKRCFATPLLSSALLPDMFCNKNNAISPEAIAGETTKTSTQRMAPTDRKGFWYGFHHQPTRCKMTRMAAM